MSNQGLVHEAIIFRHTVSIARISAPGGANGADNHGGGSRLVMVVCIHCVSSEVLWSPLSSWRSSSPLPANCKLRAPVNYIYIYITANCKLQDSVCNMIEVADTGLVTRLPRRRRDCHALVEAETVYRTRLITKALMPKRPRGRLTRTRQKHCKHDVIRYDVARHARENPAAYVCADWLKFCSDLLTRGDCRKLSIAPTACDCT